MRIAVFFVGELHDGGFNATALEGAERAAALGLAEVEIVSGVPYEEAAIRTALETVMARADGLVFVGGQGNAATPEIAVRHPDKRFAIIQGHATGPNLSSYDVRQEESAYLAGWLAALTTRSGTVGHLSGHRVPPGLRGRAAFVAGVLDAAPDVRVLTAFCGTQDDNAVARAWAEAEIEAGADVVFTMLNGAREGAIEACRTGGAKQIGNAKDWVATHPDVFVGSAIARIDVGVEHALRDMVTGDRTPGVVTFGLADSDLVSLALAADIPAPVRVKIGEVEHRLRAGEIVIPGDCTVPEFTPQRRARG